MMILQHGVKYHKARYWIHLKNQNSLTYQSLLAHCKQLGQCCEQLQKTNGQGRAKIRSLTIASTAISLIHPYKVTSWNPKCSCCGFSHPHMSFPSFGWECYNCCGTCHFTPLCGKPQTSRHPSNSYNMFPMTAQPGPRGLVATSILADWPVEVGSLSIA